MTDPTQLLPGWMLAFLNIFAAVCHLLNHILGYGWGTLAFLALLSFACVYPGIRFWAYLRKQGMGNEDAIWVSGWVAGPLCIVGLVIGGYVYYHGGNVSHPV